MLGLCFSEIIVDGTDHCPSQPMSTACDLKCLNVPDGGNATEASFCVGSGVSMYMEGFVFSLGSSKSNLCLNLLFPSGTLDTKPKFLLGCFLMMVFGGLIELLSALRKHVHKHGKHSSSSSSLSSLDAPSSPSILLTFVASSKIFDTSFHFIQAFLGYVIMLAVMTYSVELIASVCLGLALGHALFTSVKDRPPSSADPCCADYVELDSDDDDDDCDVERNEKTRLVTKP